jgi:glycosyltransferase involved in cell wall biosynthesis
MHRYSPVFQIGNAPLLPQFLGMEAFDIVHLHYPFIFGQEMIWMRNWLRRHPYVVTYHQDLLLSGLIDKGVRLHHQLVGKRVLLGAKYLIATTLDYAHASRLGELAPRMGERLVEVPNGVDGSRFNPNMLSPERLAALREQYGIEKDAFVFLFVGGLDRAHYFKGVEVFLNAFAQLVGSAETPVRLLIVGDGDLRETYQAQAAKLGIQDRVTFSGRIADSDLPSHYALGDALVLPSTTMGEAFGVVLLEAMAMGKPVIASNLPGVRTVVEDGVDGFLIKPSDVDDLAAKMTLLLADRAKASEMGRRGRAKVEARYDWSHIIPRLMDIYQSVGAQTQRSSYSQLA